MGVIELVLIAVGLSMDAFAVSICKGLSMERLKKKDVILIGIFFGGFQGLMPLIGWFLGSQFQVYIESFDHWVAFLLLALIGGKMLKDSFGDDEDESCNGDIVIKELFVLAIATSIDALAVGITFALIPGTNILSSILVIGVITFTFSIIGVVLGNKVGNKYEKKAELIGGCILILIGIKILLEHLGIL
ncbi:MAG: manganese efflux pump MntP family protein [Anaerovoracaceae bacterium]